MLKYPCLILDHDDTVVKSEATVNYPAFLKMLREIRPGAEPPTFREFTLWCSSKGYASLCRERYSFTDEDLERQFQIWLNYAMAHTPDPFPGIREILSRQRAEGGIICVASHSSRQNILRDYDVHYGLRPDCVYSCELEESRMKPSPYALDQIHTAYGVDYSEMLMVDDSITGYTMASARRVPFAWARWGREDIPEIAGFMEKNAAFCLDTPAELGKLLFPF